MGDTYTSSDLIDATAKIAWTGTKGAVTGNIKNISEPWEDFSSDPAEQTGHFFPVELDAQYDGEKITVIGKKQKTAQDRFWVLRVEQSSKFTFKKAGETLFTLDFTGATLEE